MNAAFRKEAVLTIALEGRIDTTNANGIRDEIFGLLETAQPSAIVFDASSLNYISSAGLRIIIGLLKHLNGKVSLIDASPEVYEVLEVTGLTQMMDEPKRLPELGRIMGELMREMHHTKVDSSEMPRARDKANDWVSYIADNFLEADDAALMRSVIEAIPETDTLLHLDFHEGNVMIQNDELVLIDLDDMCVGNPLYDLIAHWVGHVMSPQTSPETVVKSFGMSADLVSKIFYPTMQAYFGTDDPQVVERHSQAMQLFSLFFIMLYLGKRKDSSNLTPETIQGVLQQILPQFRQYAPQIIQMAGSYRF